MRVRLLFLRNERDEYYERKEVADKSVDSLKFLPLLYLKNLRLCIVCDLCMKYS
jgi:hypothetical protein